MALRSGSALFAVMTGVMALAGAASAQVRLPETGLNIDAGAAVRVRPTHLGSEAYRAIFVPVIDGQWGKDLHFSVDDGVQYTVVHYGRFKFGPDLEYRQAYTSALAPRTKRTSNATEAGLFTQVDLTYAELDVRVRKALDGYGGLSSDITLDTLAPLARQWSLGLEARVGWADRKFTATTFGRTTAPDPRPTSIGDYYSAGVQGALIYLPQSKTRLIVAASVDQILRPSGLARNTSSRTTATLLFVATRRFSW